MVRPLERRKTTIQRLAGWLGAKWEPIVAISALLLSAGSLWLAYEGLLLAYKGTELAKAGINVAEQTMLGEEQNRRIERTPAFTVSASPDDRHISIRNSGWGPGVGERLIMNRGSITVTINAADHPVDRQQKINSFIGSTLQDFDANFYERVNKEVLVGNPIVLLGVNETGTIIKFTKINEEDDSEWYSYFMSINAQLCYTDYLGELGGIYVLGSFTFEYPPCPAPKATLTRVKEKALNNTEN